MTLDASDQVWADPTLRTERTYLNSVANRLRRRPGEGRRC